MSKLNNLLEYGIFREGNTFFNNQITVTFNTHKNKMDFFDIYGYIADYKITFKDLQFSCSTHYNGDNPYSLFELKPKIKTVPNLKFEYYDKLKWYSCHEPLQESENKKKQRTNDVVSLLLRIFLRDSHKLFNSYKFSKILSDIKSENQYLLGFKLNFDLNKLRVYKLREVKYIQGRHYNKDYGFDLETIEYFSYYLFYENNYISDNYLFSFIKGIIDEENLEKEEIEKKEKIVLPKKPIISISEDKDSLELIKKEYNLKKHKLFLEKNK